MTVHPHFLKTAGETYGDFVVTKTHEIHELSCILRELVHLPTGALVMHLENDDPENLFCLSFKTLPSSSNGVAHILEHTVLCGSRKFPVKDPFFSMSRRSLNTFMNALTGADFTCYPAATQVEKDFYNLLDVYLDAVFHPELKKESFRQEGHRLEFAQSEDPTTPLEIKGIVYNEMKGSLSSGDSRLWHAMLKDLVPDLTYAHNSGGDPLEIPELTYSELISFHETYYHPSRCLFFFYGNLPLKKHLDFLAENGLKNVPKAPPLPPLSMQKRFTEPKEVSIKYPVEESDELSKRTMVAFGWLTAPLLSQEEVLALSVLDAVLMETDASVLKQALIESKLCVHADAYIDTDMSEVPYVIVCKGCAPDAAPKIQAVLDTTLKRIISEGIPQEMIDAAIHQLELSRLEISGDHAPFGLTLFMRSALAKQHGCDPERSLTIHALFEELLKKTEDPTYLTALLKKYLLENPHRVTLIAHPDAELASLESEQEKERLKEKAQNLTPIQKQELVRDAKELSLYQKKTETQSVECLPKVTLADAPLTVRDLPLKHTSHPGLDLYHHDCFTNHILYADLVFDLPVIKEEDLPLVHLLTTLIPELGAANRSYVDNLEFMQAHTGGITTACALHLQTTDLSSKPAFHLRGKALYRKANKLFELIHDTALTPRFDDKERIKELILQIREGQLGRLNRQALRYASQLALSGFSAAAHINEAWYGLRYFKAIEAICTDLEGTLPKLIDQLIALKEHLFTFHKPHLVISCSKEMREDLEKNDFYHLGNLPKKPLFEPWQPHEVPPPVISQARAIASGVAFNVEAFKTITYLHPHAAAMTVASHLFENKILHQRIREQGGAYGASATFSSGMGHFYFHSYRDPHITSTLNTFHLALDEIAAGKFGEQDLEEAKLGILQQMDTPISPGSRALTAYSLLRSGKTKEMRQQFRDRLFAVGKAEVCEIVKSELCSKKESSVIVSFAGKELLEKKIKL